MKKFTLTDYRNIWGEYRVFYYNNKNELKNLPAKWTDIVNRDPFHIISNGTAHFHINGLLELSQLLSNRKDIKPGKNERKGK